MSRTVHHVPLNRWNQFERDLDPSDSNDFRFPVGHVLYDLRFYAGCRRRPQKIRAEVRGGGYIHGHGGGDEVGRMAAEYEASLRNGWRMFAGAVAKACRAGEDLSGLLEPDGRHKHCALWDLC